MLESAIRWPNLFVPGAGKSGTSSLHYYLNQHPDIYMSVEKEPVFFNSLERYQSKKSKEYYLSLFSKGKNKCYRGESSTDYMQSQEAALRIKETIDHPKFIFILRNPIDRALSHYVWLKGSGFESRSFQEAFSISRVQFEHERVDHPSYYSEGLYYRWISDYIRIFGKENIHLILSERLKTAPLDTMNSCFTFLGLTRLDHIKSNSRNKSVMLKHPNLYKRIATLLSAEGDNIYKDMYRYVLPERLRIYVRRMMVNALNFFKSYEAFQTNPPTFDNEVRIWVREFYEEEVKKLCEMTSLDYHLWKDFQ